MDNKELPVAGKRKPPAAGMGRPKGTPNKTTTALKEAILKAAAAYGEDGFGKGGLEGYLIKVAGEDVKAFTGLLGKVLPLTVDAKGGLHVHLDGVVRNL